MRVKIKIRVKSQIMRNKVMRNTKVDISVKHLMLQMLSVTQFSKTMTKGL